MPLPDNFNPAEHLQDTVRRYLNREVRDWFVDLGGEEFDPDISVPRQSLRVACTHRDEDSLIMTHIRMQLFDGLIKGRFLNTLASGSEGNGTTRYSENVHRRLIPQIVLYFMESLDDVDEGFAPVDGRISFRLMDYTPQTINETIATTFANRIRSGFAIGSGFTWKKGKHMFSYSDWHKGYQLQLLVRNKSEGRRIVEQVLDIQNDVPDWANANYKENEEPATAFPTIPELEPVYGKSRRLPRRRPIADVVFQYARLEVHGLERPITLVDRTGIFADPLAT